MVWAAKSAIAAFRSSFRQLATHPQGPLSVYHEMNIYTVCERSVFSNWSTVWLPSSLLVRLLFAGYRQLLNI
jgi:hypothetical protein